MPAATDLIMSTLPPARAGVGSAVNDTVRELGGALGVAVIGSIAATRYASSMQSELTRLPHISGPMRHLLTDNVGSALHVSGHFGVGGAETATAARTAFVNSMSTSLWVAVGLAVAATVIAVTQLPRRERQDHAEPTDADLVHAKNVAVPIEITAARHRALEH